MENIFWTGYSNKDRYLTIATLQTVVAKYGDIVDCKLFSDIAVNITIEIEERNIDELFDTLKDNIGIGEFEHLSSISAKERTVYLNVSFDKGSGNLIIETPAVPG